MISYNNVTNNISFDELNNFLYAGFLLKRQSYSKYDAEKIKDGFDLIKFKEDYDSQINTWYRSVAEYIFQNFDRHYYFHFVEIKSEALSFTHPIGELSYGLGKHLFALEDIIIRVEEKQSLAIKREIADKEYQAGILYKITYNDHTREVKLNHLVIAKPDFDSENDNCFQYILANAGRPIGIEELGQAVGSKINKRLAHIVRDLGFTGNLKKIFFPVITKDKIMFMNPISREYSIKHDLPAINFKKL
ncbi:hypothetical protein KA111_00535 [Candidatus Woesebacteria bacterium]|nr:hypothetical protein [Candidatus Woesebacteria bacterium]